MPRIGISITKSVAFRDSVQQFSNVYFYVNTGSLPDGAGADNLIDEVTALERPRHSTLVSFVIGRVWSQGGSPGTNNMISQKTLTGTGSGGSDPNMDKERAYLFRRRAGTDSRGNPVYLRKWYHVCGSWDSGVAASATIQSNATGFTSGQRTTLAGHMTNFNTLTSGGGGWEICAKSGRQATQPLWEAHKYLEHHQLGDMWRG